MPVMTFAEALPYAERQREHTNIVIGLRARELAKQHGITEEQAWGRALRDPALARAYQQWRDPHAAALRLSTQSAEEETQQILAAHRAEQAKPDWLKELEALAVEIAQAHDISVQDAMQHALRRRPDLQDRWFAYVHQQTAAAS